MRKARFWIIGIIILLMSGCMNAGVVSTESRIKNVENGLIVDYCDTSSMMNLSTRMEHHGVPGVSIAMIDNFEIEWVKGYGVLKVGKNDRVTPKTLFQSASIAKPIVACAVLEYVQNGTLDLDTDVNKYLKSWQVPENKFTVNEKVTLRRLLSHSAGITVSGFKGYAKGAKIPDLKQILNGTPPSNSQPITVDAVPGSQYRYSGGGYMIVQQLLEDVTDLSFPEIMQRTVLMPLNMDYTSLVTPLVKHLLSFEATGHRSNGVAIPGGWHTYPEMGAGASMWSTPSDIAKFLISVMKSYEEISEEILLHDTAIEMLTPQIGNSGLGLAVVDEGGDLFYFMHSGANEGYRTVMVAYPKMGQGVVIMTNSDNGEALWGEILRSISVEYGWIRDNTGLYVTVAVLILLFILFVFFTWIYRKKIKTVQSHLALI